MTRLNEKKVHEGWFQCHEYYQPRRARIREWLAFDPSIVVPNDSYLVVHVLRTDYVQFGPAMSFEFDEQAIERLLPAGGIIWIVIEDRKDPFVKHFERWKPKFYEGSALQHLS